MKAIWISTTVWSLLLIESTYLACLAKTYAVSGKTKVLRRDSRLAARLRSRATQRERCSLATFLQSTPNYVRLFNGSPRNSSTKWATSCGCRESQNSWTKIYAIKRPKWLTKRRTSSTFIFTLNSSSFLFSYLSENCLEMFTLPCLFYLIAIYPKPTVNKLVILFQKLKKYTHLCKFFYFFLSVLYICVIFFRFLQTYKQLTRLIPSLSNLRLRSAGK